MIIDMNGTIIVPHRDTTKKKPMTFGPDQKEVVQDKILAQVARDRRVEIPALRAVLDKLGHSGVKDEDIFERLDAAAYELQKLWEVELFQQGPPALAVRAEEAKSLINKGDFDGARHALMRGREAVRAQESDLPHYQATFLEQEAQVDDLQLAYRAAAKELAEDAGVAAPFDTGRFLIAQAGELYKLGDEFGDNAALAEAIDLYHRYLAQRWGRPIDRTVTLVNLGTALRVLDAREGSTARLEEAFAAYREAMEELCGAHEPLYRATTQMNLGPAVQRVGERESRTEKLEETIAADREALKACKIQPTHGFYNVP